MTRAIAVPGARDLPAGRGMLVEAGALRIALFRVGDGWFALDDLCPHRTGPLSEGTLDFTARGVRVTCPFHGWQFDLASGACTTVRGKSVRTYAVRVDDAGVWIELPDDPPAP